MIFMTDWHGCTFCSLIIGGARLMHGPISKILPPPLGPPRIDAPGLQLLLLREVMTCSLDVSPVFEVSRFYNIWKPPGHLEHKMVNRKPESSQHQSMQCCVSLCTSWCFLMYESCVRVWCDTEMSRWKQLTKISGLKLTIWTVVALFPTRYHVFFDGSLSTW